jgi:hypothetical protein
MNISKYKQVKICCCLMFLTCCNNPNVNTQKMKQNDTLDVLNKNISNQTKQYDSIYIYIEEIFKSKSLKEKKNLKCYIWSENNSKIIHLKFGYDLEWRIETIYNFYVDMKTKEIKFMTINGDLVLFDKKLDLDKLNAPIN